MGHQTKQSDYHGGQCSAGNGPTCSRIIPDDPWGPQMHRMLIENPQSVHIYGIYNLQHFSRFLEDKLVFTQTIYIEFVRTDWGYPAPECPRTPARGPQALHHHPRGACRRNFWSGIFDPRDIGATRNQITVGDPSFFYPFWKPRVNFHLPFETKFFSQKRHF